MKAKDLPQYYTAREVSEAFTNLLTSFVQADDVAAEVYARLMSVVANGKIAALGIVDGQLVCGLPSSACWLNKETQ